MPSPETSRRLTWVRASERYPDAAGTDSFIALDGEVEVGVMKLVPAPAGAEWMWSLWLTSRSGLQAADERPDDDAGRGGARAEWFSLD